MKPFIGSFDNWLLKSNNKSSVSIFETADESLYTEEPEKKMQIMSKCFEEMHTCDICYKNYKDEELLKRHTSQTCFLRCQDRQGSPVSLLSLLNDYNNNNSTTSQLPAPITPLKSPPSQPIFTAIPIDEFYNPKKSKQIIVLDESPLTLNPPATPASPKVEPYDPEEPGMDRREVIFKEEIPFYPPRKIDLNSRYGRTYDWSHLQLPNATWVKKIRNKAREFNTEIKVVPDGYLGVKKEEKVILPDGTIYLLTSTWIPDPEILKRRNMGIQTDKDMASEIEEFELVELSTEAKETQTDVQTEDTGIQSSKRKVICEDSKTTLSCPSNQVIKITQATYGRSNKRTCKHPNMKTTRCATKKPLGISRKNCNGRKSCTVAANNRLYGDPCPGTYKYVTVTYSCKVKKTPKCLRRCHRQAKCIRGKCVCKSGYKGDGIRSCTNIKDECSYPYRRVGKGCYLIQKDNVSGDTAFAKCLRRGAYLANFETLNEAMLMKYELLKMKTGVHYYVGGRNINRYKTGGDWRWIKRTEKWSR
ncbi:unnamed protein product [Mytilus edulis]|uniref:SUEL-type lectin domain-containing protein n=1 Tax=Mytilus edulis TaxID=6550 RepID=A0A8S3U5C9_MYTED|nr:unnamed protein product [Mytilus edulis]